MKAKITIVVAAGVLLAVPAFASAADQYGHGPGVQVQANGGVLTFPGEAAGRFSPGGTYGASVDFRPLNPVGLELGYQGASYGLERGSGNVMENGGQALLKLGPHLGAVEPYALGGYNLTWVNPNNAADAAGINSDTIQKVPVGAGVDFDIPVGSNPLVLGARGTYNFVFSNQAFSTTSSSGDDQIGGQVVLGGEF
jgi:hypothetical protein